MNIEALEQKLSAHHQKEWMLRDSGTSQGDAGEIDKAIEKIRKHFKTTSKKRLEKLARELADK
jgi:hypothetical protein